MPFNQVLGDDMSAKSTQLFTKSEQLAEIIKRHGFAKIMDQKGMVLYVPPGYIQSIAAQGPVPASDRFGDQVGRRPWQALALARVPGP